MQGWRLNTEVCLLGMEAQFIQERWLKWDYRQETAASVTHLVHMLRQSPQLPSEFRVLDLCTGTGCIPLLFRHELYAMRKDIDLRCIGIDISKTALELARRNLKRIDLDEENGKRGTIEFLEADVLIDEYSEHTMESLRAILNWQRKPRFWDVLISNPPYISPEDYWKTTTRSVRGFEPKLALVPPKVRGNMEVEEADVFYPRLLEIAQDSEAKVVLFEVADLNQAERVARMAQNLEIFDGIEIWRDQPDGTDNDTPNQPQLEFPVIGSGHGRSVVCWRGAGAFWLGKTDSSREHEERSLEYRDGDDHLRPTFDYMPDPNEKPRRYRINGAFNPPRKVWDR